LATASAFFSSSFASTSSIRVSTSPIPRIIPGLGKQLENADIDDRQIDWCEAIIYSMTLAEREKPSLINASRRKELLPVQVERLKKLTDF